jgi:hypothetical protein
MTISSFLFQCFTDKADCLNSPPIMPEIYQCNNRLTWTTSDKIMTMYPKCLIKMWNFDSSETCVHHVTYNYKESAYISGLGG